MAMPGVSVPHFAHGCLGPNPLDHGAGELGRSSTSPQIRCPDVVLHNRRFERAAQALGRLELAQMIEHHRGGEHLGRRRSEEHTSELQSQSNLVCRLLLEKKKNKITSYEL